MSEITPNTPNPVREDAYKNELATKLGIDPQYIPESPVWRNEEEIAALAEMFANMSGSSGGGVLVANMSYSEDLETITADKTASEMWSAAQGGIILAKSVFPGMTRIELVTTAEYSDEVGYTFNVGKNYFLYASAGTDYPRTGAGNSGGK